MNRGCRNRTAVAAVALAIGLVAGSGAGAAAQESGAPSDTASVQTVGLDACVREAVSTSQRLDAARQQQTAAAARADGAQARRLPRVSASGTYDYMSEVERFTIPGAGTITLGDGNTYVFGVGVDVPVFTGGALAATAHAARDEARATNYDVAGDSLSVVREARMAFYRALASRAEHAAAKTAVNRLQRHLARVEDALSIGTASDEARVETVARLRAAEQRMIAAEEQAVADEFALGRIVGRPGERVAPAGDIHTSILGAAPLQGTAYEKRPELTALAVRRRESDLRARAAIGSLLPSLSAGARYNVGRPGVDPIADQWMNWASAHVALSWTLWDWGARMRQVDEARASARAIDARRTDVHRRLQEAFATASSRIDFARRQGEKATQRRAAEARRLELVGARHDAGMASETEYLDAQDDLAEAEAAEVQTVAALRLAEAELLYAAGR